MADDFRIRRDDPAAGAGNNAPAEAEQTAQGTPHDQSPGTSEFILDGSDTARRLVRLAKNADAPPVASRVRNIGLFEIIDPRLADQVETDITTVRDKIGVFTHGFRPEIEGLAERIRAGRRIPSYVLSNTGGFTAAIWSLLGNAPVSGDFPFSFSTLWEYVDLLPSALKRYAVERRFPYLSLEIHFSLPVFLRWAAQNPSAFENGMHFFYIRNEFLTRFVRFAIDNGAMRIIALPNENYTADLHLLRNRARHLGVEIVVADGLTFEAIDTNTDKKLVEDVVNEWSESVLGAQHSEKYETVAEAEEIVRRLRAQGLSASEIIDSLQTSFDLPHREARGLFISTEEAIRAIDGIMSLVAKSVAEDRPYGDRHGGQSVIDPEPQRSYVTNVSRTNLPADREPPQALLQDEDGKYKVVSEGARIPEDFVGFLAYESVLYRIDGIRVAPRVNEGFVTPREGQQVGLFRLVNGRLIFSPSTVIRELLPGDSVDIPNGQSVRRFIRGDEFEFTNHDGVIMAARVMDGDPVEARLLDQIGFGKMQVTARPDGNGIQATERTAARIARISLTSRVRGRTVYDMVAPSHEWLAERAAERAAAAGNGAENAAQDSTVTGLVDDTGETSGGAFASGAAHLYPAAQHARSRQAQRTTGYTQLASAQRAIRAGYAVTNAALPVTRPIVRKF